MGREGRKRKDSTTGRSACMKVKKVKKTKERKSKRRETKIIFKIWGDE